MDGLSIFEFGPWPKLHPVQESRRHYQNKAILDITGTSLVISRMHTEDRVPIVLASQDAHEEDECTFAGDVC